MGWQIQGLTGPLGDPVPQRHSQLKYSRRQGKFMMQRKLLVISHANQDALCQVLFCRQGN